MEMMEFCMRSLLYIVIYSGDSPMLKSEPLFSEAAHELLKTSPVSRNLQVSLCFELRVYFFGVFMTQGP